MPLAILTRFLRSKRFNRALQYQTKWLHPDPKEVCGLQLEKLNCVWRDAVSNMPYYQRLVSKKEAPSHFNSLADFFKNVPILTKEKIAASPDLFRRPDEKPDRIAMTAGSTGNPLHFGLYKREADFSSSDLFVGRIANGMEMGDRIFLLWGHSHLLGTGWKGKYKHLLRKTSDWALSYKRMDAYHLDRQTARSYMKKLLDFNPQICIGYASALDLFVRHNEDFRQQVKGLGLKFVVATSEVMPRPDSHKIIEDFFNCPLVMEYGGVEFGAVAHNRPYEPYRVYWWNCLAETLDEAGTAAANSTPLVVTSLYLRYVPFIRYRTGDEIRGERTVFNRSLVSFSEVCGRHNDALELTDGSILHSVSLFHCIHQESDVYNIQLIVDPAGLHILLVANNKDPQMISRIRRRLRDLSPLLENCEIKIVPDLVTNRAGKRRWIVYS